jgi:hypothetical protein
MYEGLLMSIATDHALATIASILAPPEAARGRTRQAQLEKSAAAIKPVVKVPFDAAGYAKSGPGPMAEIRMEWTVRRGDDGYYVDETIGAGSIPVVNGPMSSDAAVGLVDARAREAQERFEALRSEMTGLGPSAPILASGGGET